ncbi:TPA: hypothetical protein OMU11_003839 [Enterobacter hormaechei]|uniref:hypothetical protein n=1 Tax=Enterobacter hormaechei TaxID=158836 RepID=UPI000735ACA0|nr:hypothetical protein [Enterobacter hormaechei]DAL18433.1 MAG TPA_asm: hypothetical protein [Caudoviricetes sp.]EGQ5289315.1 hypothetical protein [Enterobacter hormaechei]ELC6280473.1 hypothetical protein [Enterobacter hormaechei]KTI38506.1 hypothetical protein ASV04_22950 [Enterobacter hormaechei subsp. xiangfangensis]MBL6036214.1 hypothetical protein [Enterobacter hormaechei]
MNKKSTDHGTLYSRAMSSGIGISNNQLKLRLSDEMTQAVINAVRDQISELVAAEIKKQLRQGAFPMA